MNGKQLEVKSKFMRHQKTKTNQKIFNVVQQENRSPSEEIFSSFLYQDHVTRYKYQFSKLKKWRILKTCPDESETPQTTQLTFYNEELKVLQAIKQNRNKELLENFKTRTAQKSTRRINTCTESPYEEISKVKRKIRKQVLSLNHQFLREYLYHHQPFNKMLVEINHESNAGIIDEARINALKAKIVKCMDQRKDDKRCPLRESLELKKLKLSQRKLMKESTSKRVDGKFQEIWEQIRKQIGSRVRMEGEYNLYGVKPKAKK